MTTDPLFTADQIEAARKLFAGQVAFVKGVVAMSGLPPADRPEIAFAGRSNVGKSSLINALVGRKALARASNTPGRTQEINFFDLAAMLYLVDLPGYGFADAPKASVEAWSKFTLKYLRGRPTLKRVMLLVDSRRGVGEVDVGIMKQLDAAAVGYQIVLTKIDKLRPSESPPSVADAMAALKKHPAAHPRILSTSAEDGAGLPELKAEIHALV
jgi:GTP-binding protein